MAYFGADGEIRPPRFRARRHAPGHQNSPQDCFYASHCPFRISLLKKEQAQKCLFFFWRRWRDSPASLPRSAARTRAPKQSTGLFLCFALPFSNLFIKKKNKHKSACSFFGADGEIRTLAAVAHPTPLAGAPRHQLEYICKTVTITHTVKFNTD